MSTKAEQKKVTFYGTVTIRFEGDSEEFVEKISEAIQTYLAAEFPYDIENDIWSSAE